jgi:hypothetical protein
LFEQALGALDEAIDVLERAPGEMAVRLFLGFAYPRKNELGKAEAHLTAFVNLEPDRRLAPQAKRTSKVVRSESLSEEMRTFAFEAGGSRGCVRAGGWLPHPS